MSWTKEISVWNTLFKLKKNDSNLGIKEEIFFAVDFAKDLQTGEFKTVIAYLSFNGMDLGKGISSYIITKEELEEKFTLLEDTFSDMEIECRKKFLNQENNIK